MLKKNLLTILFVLALLPMILVLVYSTITITEQSEMTTKTSGRYVRDLAFYAADQWSAGRLQLALTFLALVSDRGYDAITPKFPESADPQSSHGKFVPGMVAYITLSGRMIACSKNAEILGQVFEQALAKSGGRIVGADGNIVGEFHSGDGSVKYVAYIAPTKDPRIYAVAAVTMLSWMGRNDIGIIKLSAVGMIATLICLAALFLLRGSVISPLRALSSLVETLRWGKEVPQNDAASFGDIAVDEISSLKKAVRDLAVRMIEKEELEKRYMGDIIKAQEEERGRIAQDIHDGPIQVASALMQKIQIASLTESQMTPETRDELTSAESVANDLIRDLRGVCDALVPPWISLGLPSCIEEAAARLERQHGISIMTDVMQDIDVPQSVTLALFRIFQEAVSNAVRHGHADEVRFDASISDDRLIVTITDNGCGSDDLSISSDDLMRAGKRGLNGMKQRAEFLGGKCEIRSAKDIGTTVEIKIPL